ncbi:MAG: glycosyltransferase [Candidatus Shapirobacteria bacterium]|jgi:dolichol-phosphate mannosyltransferase
MTKNTKPSQKTAVVVIATYNEAGAIGNMIDTLFGKIFPKITNWHCQVLVVDDTSPDKTYEIVQRYQKKYSDLHLVINPEKKGMGNAIVKGFQYAMQHLKADVVCEFDADFQHPPEDIPNLLAKIDEGYDFVIGSRKIKGGSVPSSWGFMRKFWTYVGGFASRSVMFFPFPSFFKVTDPTTGLRASRVKGFVDQIDLDHLYSLKFGYKIELLYRMINLKAKFTEIPLRFGLRETGESKISKDTARDIFFVSLKCRWYDEFTQKFLKFGLVGGFGFIINVVGARVFKSFLLTPDSNISLINGLSNGLAAEISIISNFIWNNLWTFKSEKITQASQLVSKFLTFNLSSILNGIVIPSVIISLLTGLFGDHLFLYQVIAIFGLTIPLNWLTYNRVIWKKK